MESKFQDLLKNIIPGFFIFFCITAISNITDIVMINKLIEDILIYSTDLLIVILPLIFFIIGYINDILSSQIEYWIYKCGVSRPSFVMLNDNTIRYRLPKLIEIKSSLSINEQSVDKKNAYKYFQDANAVKKDSKELNEFYLAYIFARNVMTASFLVFIFSLLSLVSMCNFDSIKIIIASVSLLIIFGHRWRQRAFYYTKKVFLSI